MLAERVEVGQHSMIFGTSTEFKVTFVCVLGDQISARVSEVYRERHCFMFMFVDIVQ